MRETALFALASGPFAAGVVATPVVLAGISVGGLSPLALAGIVAVAAAAGGIGGANATVSPETVRRFQNYEWSVVAGFGLALVYLVVTFVVTEVWTGADDPRLYPGLAGTGLVVVGLAGMAHASESLATQYRVADSDLHVRLPPAMTDRQRRVSRWLGAIGVAVMVVFGILSLVTDLEFPLYFLFIVVPGLVQLTSDGRHERAITDEGFKRGHSIRPWGQFEGYELRRHYLAIERSGWWGDVRIRRDRIEDEEAVLSALETVFDDKNGES